ncbi:MAG: exosortase E/protease, VPEID-CTERM system [Candidatus Dadabacteria bacterium]|nr:MAG: exosortase E/protease, VPEID-CTERM system [Candidatus Dadabacteria bacterium]
MLVPQVAVAAATVAALVGGKRLLEALAQAAAQVRSKALVWTLLLAHAAAYAVFVRLTREVFEGTAATSPALLVAWICAGLCVPGLLVAAAFPLEGVRMIARASGRVLLVATLAGLAAWLVGYVLEFALQPLRSATLATVYFLLSLVRSDAIADPAASTVGAGSFAVSVARQCSGYQGIGMIWVFLAVYLWAFRDVLRFPRSLLLVPIATAAVWLANALRVFLLVLLGAHGHEAIALGGFHRYVGALLFSAVALAVAWASNRSAYFRADVPSAAPQEGRATAAYLMPMLAVLALALVTGALGSGGLDRYYPLRVLAVLACLWWYRGCYGELRATLSWHAVLTGAAVFALWVATAQALPENPSVAAAAREFRTMAPPLAAAWLAFRLAGAIVTVPIAEELAFRGYLARRVTNRDFLAVPLTAMPWPGIIVSSLAFGALHNRILAGSAAGLVYALAARRRGELSDAVIAHATTNALLAAYVLITGNWGVWG